MHISKSFPSFSLSFLVQLLVLHLSRSFTYPSTTTILHSTSHPHILRQSRKQGGKEIVHQIRWKNVLRFMFTGIVEEMGTVIHLTERDDMQLWDGTLGKGTELSIQCTKVLEGAYLGCSICVSGVCLTVTEFQKDRFTVGLAPETLRRTYLGQLRSGSMVNLERASEIGGRNSGHFVQGHIDGLGHIIDRWIDENSLFYKIQTTRDILNYIVPKGFVAIDGTSLTVCEVNYHPDQLWFTFMLVEYTQKKIIVPQKGISDLVNIEVDVLGKYSENSVSSFRNKIDELENKVKDLEAKIDLLNQMVMEKT